MSATLRQEVKALRIQMAKLEEKCKDREDKVVRLVLLLQPFLNALAPELINRLLQDIDKFN